MNSTDRLKKAIEILKNANGSLTNEAISLNLGYRSKGYISDLIGGSKPINDIFLEKLQVEYSINPEWILNGVGEMLLKPEGLSNNETYTQKRNNKKLNESGKQRIPLYDAPAAAGTTETEMIPIHAPAGTIDVGDLLHDSQAAIRIYGNSMIPGYPPGCVVGLSKCDKRFIEPGEVYVVETRDRRMLKRLFYKDDDADSNFLMCYSDNTLKFNEGARHGKLAYPPFNIPISEIINLFVVTGVIKRNINSLISNNSI